MDYHLAQANIGRLLAPIDDPQIAGFKNNLDKINALAETSPGFVWRLKDDSNNATDIRLFDDPNMLVNLSVWESIDALYQYTYYSEHTAFFRRRAEWFEKLPTSPVVLWWIPADTLPKAEDLPKKFDHLETHGSTPLAFTFKERFTAEEMLAYTQKA